MLAAEAMKLLSSVRVSSLAVICITVQYKKLKLDYLLNIIENILLIKVQLTNDIELHLTYSAVKPDGDPVVIEVCYICSQEVVHKLVESGPVLPSGNDVPEFHHMLLLMLSPKLIYLLY